jgi:cellulose synthase (UDP-forming)
MMTYPNKPGAVARLFRVLVFCLTAFLLFQFISLDLSWPNQLILGCVSIVLGIVVNRLSTSRALTMALMLISIAATLRYGWWRVRLLIDYFSDESNNHGPIDTTFLLLLILAELYTVIIMFLGYMQTAWPLQRKPIPLPADDSQWPHVDVLIPTYNEALSLVRYTVLAANDMDYPPDKLHVFILDDGSREDYREFAEQTGVGYITRLEHGHAKAGNINHALTLMNSPYVAIFDCDHVPTRSFLQLTMGWMIVDPKLGMLQTPHHFYSPDPFERNLPQYKTIPNEEELFYGIVQDGNDFWNATFFCGSCAVLRRSALDEVGGIAVETVTEDAHTSLRMQKKGYNTAYINIPQAAGLATETLAAHVGQRIRWARGMIQILRIDNPLFGGNLKLSQRLCYFNAMAHFLYAVPRLVFLCAPLVYLLLGRTIIPGYWVAIMVYALPHLILSSLTNSRAQSWHRHSFWNEIYETVLAPYILMPTLLALINPKLGKFNVTDKGSTLAESRFDRKIAYPTEWLLLLNFAGMVSALYQLCIVGTPHPGAVVMNLFWVFFNMVILGVAAAVAYEQQQRRGSVRIDAVIPVRATLADGSQFQGMTIDMSVGGASIRLTGDTHIALGDSFKLAFPDQTGDAEINVKAAGVKGDEFRLEFSIPTIPEQEIVTRALYSRADAWISPIETKEVDRPLVSLGRVIKLSIYGIYQIIRSWFPRKSVVDNTPSASAAALLLVALALGAWSEAFAASKPAGAPSNKASMATAALPSAFNAAPQILSFKDMGLLRPIEMRGPHSYYTIRFTLSYTMMPRSAALKLISSVDPALDPQASSLKVILNGTTIATLPPAPASGAKNGFNTTIVPVPDTFLVRNNTLTFEFTGSGVMQSEEQARARVFLRINPASTLEVHGDQLLWENNLNQLPLPIFDPALQTTTVVPFVFLAQPSPKALQAAGVVASWLGLLSSTKPVRFSVFVGSIPPENAVVFSSDPALLPASLKISPGGGAAIALRTNPSNQNGNVLVLAGDGDDQLLAVARTLSLSRKPTAATAAEGLPLSGDTMSIPELVMPPARNRDDAPRWLPVHRGTPLAGCRNPEALQTDGANPVPIYFHVPPDLYYGERQNLGLHLHYRYNAYQAAAGSALRVFINGVMVSDIPLPPGKAFAEGQRNILVPVASIRPFGNTIFFNFDFAPANRPAPQNQSLEALQGEILCNTSLDLQGLPLWTSLPNLELFANAGFPFTQYADLSRTTVVLPTAPTPDEIALYLHLMSHFGAQTGYPALRVTVDGPNAVIRGDSDYLVLGTVSNQPAFHSFDALLPVTFDSSGIHVKERKGFWDRLASLEGALARWWSSVFGNTLAPFGNPVEQDVPTNVGVPDALVEEIASPASKDRSIVLVALWKNQAADTFASVFLDRSQSRDITGSVSLLNNSVFKSYVVDNGSYHIGNITWFAVMRIILTRHFLLLLFLVTALSLLLGFWVYQWLAWRAHERVKIGEKTDSSH